MIIIPWLIRHNYKTQLRMAFPLDPVIQKGCIADNAKFVSLHIVIPMFLFHFQLVFTRVTSNKTLKNFRTMPSTRKYTDRKRPRPSDCDEDSQPTKQKNGKPHFRIDQLLKAYRDKQLNEDSDKVLKYVPESVKSVFVPYIKHVQTINNNLYSIKSLFDSNAKSLKLELTDKFEEVAKNTQNKLNKISDDLISELISNFDQDPVYESMKAACVKPIVSLDK